MKTSIKLFSLILLIFGLVQSQPLSCENKKIVEEISLDENSDNKGKIKFTDLGKELLLLKKEERPKIAENKKFSCMSLNTEDQSKTCCYIEVRYKANGKSYKMRGCVPVSLSNIYNGANKGTVKDLVNEYKQGLPGESLEETMGITYEKTTKVSIECDTSSYLKIAGLIILALLF